MKKSMTNSGWSRPSPTVAFSLFLVLFVLTGLFFFFPRHAKAPHELTYVTHAEAQVSFPTRDASVTVEISDTVEKRTLGLSNRKDLPENHGMLFVFEAEDTYGFWMKDMNFTIDILWFDSNLRLVDMWQNATPDSYPKITEPRTPARYVLEVPAGFAEKHSLTIGDEMQISEAKKQTE